MRTIALIAALLIFGAAALLWYYADINYRELTANEHRIAELRIKASLQQTRKVTVAVKRPAPKELNSISETIRQPQRQDQVSGQGPKGNSQLASVRAASTRALLRGRFAYLYASLKLPPDKIQKLEEVLADNINTLRAYDGVGTGVNTAEADSLLRKGLERQLEKLASSAIGQDAATSFVDTLKLREAHAVLTELNSNAIMRGDGLSFDQATAVISAMTTSLKSSGTGFNIEDVDWEKAQSIAKQYLTPTQMDIFTNLAAIQHFNSEYSKITGVRLRPPTHGF